MADDDGGDAPGPSRLTKQGFGLALAAYAGVAGWLVWRTSILEPFSDMFDWLERWKALQANHDLVRYLWAPHNFHHLVWTFAVLHLDLKLFGGQGYLFLAVGTACLVATAAMLGRLGAEAAGPGLRLVGGGVALAIGLMGCDVLDATTDIEITYLQALVFAVAAILLAGGSGAPSWRRRAASLLCAAAAGLGSAAGLAVWPALVVSAWRGGRRGWGLMALAAGAACSAAYLVGESTGAGSGGGLVGLSHGLPSPGASLALTLAYLGLPWMHVAPRLAELIGIAVLVPSLAALVFRGGRRSAPAEQSAIALIVFSLATAIMTGVARTADMTPALTPLRYAVFLIPLHVGLWVLALPYLKRAWAARPGLANPTTIVLALALLGHQAVMAVFAVRTADANLRVVADFREGRRTPAMTATIHPDLARAQAISDELRRRGLYQRELRPDPPRPPSGSGTSASSPGP